MDQAGLHLRSAVSAAVATMSRASSPVTTRHSRDTSSAVAVPNPSSMKYSVSGWSSVMSGPAPV